MKNTSKDGIAYTTFQDAVVPKQGTKGTWGGMTGPILIDDARPETKGELPGVQFADLGDYSTKKPFGK